MATTEVRLEGCAGEVRVVVLRSPSWPFELIPHAQIVPSARPRAWPQREGGSKAPGGLDRDRPPMAPAGVSQIVARIASSDRVESSRFGVSNLRPPVPSTIALTRQV